MYLTTRMHVRFEMSGGSPDRTEALLIYKLHDVEPASGVNYCIFIKRGVCWKSRQPIPDKRKQVTAAFPIIHVYL